MSYRLLKKMVEGDFSFDTSMSQVPQEEPNPAAGIFSKETEDHPDVVAMDIPTLIRVMEWSHEDAKDDVEIHEFANAMILLSFDHSPLTMEDYQTVVDTITPPAEQPGQPSQQDAMPSGSVEMQNN